MPKARIFIRFSNLMNKLCAYTPGKQDGDSFSSRSVLVQRFFSKFAQNGIFAEQILKQNCLTLNKEV